jgi:hypothetical protein
MAKLVEVPCDVWSNSKLIADPFSADDLVIDYVIECCCCLVGAYRTTVQQLNLAIFHQLANQVPIRIIKCALKPAFEEV